MTMAKRRRRRSTSVAVAPRTVVRTVRAPAPIVRVSVPKAVPKRFHKRYRRAAAGVRAAGIASKPQLYAMGGAALLGFAEKENWNLPRIPKMSTAASAGIISWAAARMTKSPILEHVSTGLLCVALYRATSGKKGSDEIVGDGVVAAYGEDVDGYDYE